MIKVEINGPTEDDSCGERECVYKGRAVIYALLENMKGKSLGWQKLQCKRLFKIYLPEHPGDIIVNSEHVKQSLESYIKDLLTTDIYVWQDENGKKHKTRIIALSRAVLEGV